MTARASLPLRLGVLLVAAIVPLGLATKLDDPTPPIAITIDGAPATVASASRLGSVVRELQLRPARGRLLAVDGHVLDPNADPGRILVNGVPRRGATVLHAGDAIAILDGIDRTESTRRVTTRLAGRQVGDPQYSLATARMVRVDTLGRVSNVVVSTDYRPTGGARRPREVALTFDDGPWPRTTTAILHVLHRMHAKATFFVIGYLAKRYPRLVRDELRDGMVVGSHSWDHPEPFEEIAPERMRTELATTNRFLRETFGVRPTLFRPPGGSGATDVVTEASLLGMRVVDWNVDPRDWSADATPKSIAGGVLAQVGPGSIVDLHDGGGDQRATVKALPTIIRGIRKMHLKLVVLR